MSEWLQKASLFRLEDVWSNYQSQQQIHSYTSLVSRQRMPTKQRMVMHQVTMEHFITTSFSTSIPIWIYHTK